MLGEARHRVHEAPDFDDALDPIEISEKALRLREQIERAEPRAHPGLVDGHLIADPADAAELPVPGGDLPGQEEERAGLHAGHEVGDGRRRGGQFDVQRAEPRLDSGGHLDFLSGSYGKFTAEVFPPLTTTATREPGGGSKRRESRAARAAAPPGSAAMRRVLQSVRCASAMDSSV